MTRLNILIVSWLTAVLAALVIGSVVALVSPLPEGYYTPEEAKEKLVEYNQEWQEQYYTSLANMYEGLAQWSESRALASIPTGYPLIDAQLPDPDEYYQQAAEFREQAEEYRAMTDAGASTENS